MKLRNVKIWAALSVRDSQSLYESVCVLPPTPDNQLSPLRVPSRTSACRDLEIHRGAGAISLVCNQINKIIRRHNFGVDDFFFFCNQLMNRCSPCRLVILGRSQDGLTTVSMLTVCVKRVVSQRWLMGFSQSAEADIPLDCRNQLPPLLPPKVWKTLLWATGVTSQAPYPHSSRHRRSADTTPSLPLLLPPLLLAHSRLI